MTNVFNGMFGKVKPGMCRLSMSGKIAIKTSNGYKAYDVTKNRLTNCDSFVFDIGEDMFFVIPTNKLERVLGDSVRQRETETNRLYELASKKFNIYHICIKDNASSYRYYENEIFDDQSSCSWVNVLGRENVIVSTIEALPQNISMLVRKSNSGIIVEPEIDSILADDDNNTVVDNADNEGISW